MSYLPIEQREVEGLRLNYRLLWASYRSGQSQQVRKAALEGSEMKLERGKRYKTRDGRVTGPLYEKDSKDCPFGGLVGVLILSWRVNGRYTRGGESAEDLISEYTEEEQPMFKVGDKVRYLVDEDAGDIYVILALHNGQAWLEHEDTNTWVTLVSNLAIVPEPKHLRWSVPKLMTIGWGYNNLVPTRNRKR